MQHAHRRSRILRDHPEIRSLMGPDHRTKWVCGGLVAMQLLLSSLVGSFSLGGTLVLAYVAGATITQALFLAIHEASHNLLFRGDAMNRCAAILFNLPITIPFAIAFRHYHIDHHKHQGVEGLDVDLPSRAEERVVCGTASKLAWLSVQIVAYAARPLVCSRHPLPLTPLLCGNILSQIAFDCALVWTCGARALAYLLLSVLLAGGLHPCAGHFLSEHYLFSESGTQDTFSYYGPLNRITWNVGYHVEHHDFPNIPGSRLPAVHAIAPEWYRGLASRVSWVACLWDFVTNPGVSLRSRHRR